MPKMQSTNPDGGVHQGDPENPGLKNVNFDAPSDLFEVMVDTWGHDPAHQRGDFLTAADTPYDIEWAEKIGTVRRLTAGEAANVQESGLESATQPVGVDMKVDPDVQRNARSAAGLPPRPEDQDANVKPPSPAASSVQP